MTSLQSEDTLYLVVRKKHELIGYCGFLQSFDEADITNVAVSPAYRGKGVGYAMLAELMRREGSAEFPDIRLKYVSEMQRRSGFITRLALRMQAQKKLL